MGPWEKYGGQATASMPSRAPSRQQRAPVSAFPGDPVETINGLVPGVRITSGYRDPERNRRAGGAANSNHTRGQAFDLAPPSGQTMAQLEASLRSSGLPFRELINEGDHVHVAWEGSPLSPDQTADYFAGGGAAPQPATGGPWAKYGGGTPEVTPVYADTGARATPESGAIEVTSYDPELEARQRDPEYQAAIADATARSENVPDRLRALTQGGALGFLDEIVGASAYARQGLENAGNRVAGRENTMSASMAAQAARDSERAAADQFAQENPIENFGLSLAGGLLTPGLAAGGNYIAGAQGAGRLARAAGVGAGYGAVSGAGYDTGNIADRGDGAAMGALVGAGTGVIGQAGADRLARLGVNAAARPASAARRLSREGVDLTPGQMLASTPGVGGMIRSLEEGASSIPFVGSPIAGARQQSVETFNRAAINRALAPIGSQLPKGTNAGYEAVENAQRQLGQAYEDVLPRVTARIDDDFDIDLSALNDRAQAELTEPLARQFDNIIQQRVFRNIPDDEVIQGANFKTIESELGALSREYRTALDPQNRALSRLLDDTQDVVRDLVARQNPAEAGRIRNINRGYANLVRVEQAAGSTASQATEGVFSPTQLGVASARGAGRSANAREGALMQDLAVAGRNIIPSRVGDSGTATRGAITGLVAGGAAGVPLAGTLAIPVIATSVLYSRPAQAALNAVYRATDSRGANSSLQQLARLAQRNPALVPYYEAAVQHALGLGRTGIPAAQPAPPSTQAPSPALQRVMQ